MEKIKEERANQPSPWKPTGDVHYIQGLEGRSYRFLGVEKILPICLWACSVFFPLDEYGPVRR